MGGKGKEKKRYKKGEVTQILIEIFESFSEHNFTNNKKKTASKTHSRELKKEVIYRL